MPLWPVQPYLTLSPSSWPQSLIRWTIPSCSIPITKSINRLLPSCIRMTIKSRSKFTFTPPWPWIWAYPLRMALAEVLSRSRENWKRTGRGRQHNPIPRRLLFYRGYCRPVTRIVVYQDHTVMVYPPSATTSPSYHLVDRWECLLIGGGVIVLLVLQGRFTTKDVAAVVNDEVKSVLSSTETDIRWERDSLDCNQYQ